MVIIAKILTVHNCITDKVYIHVHVQGVWGRLVTWDVQELQYSAVITNVQNDNASEFLGAGMCKKNYHAGHVITTSSIIICVRSQTGITELEDEM